MFNAAAKLFVRSLNILRPPAVQRHDVFFVLPSVIRLRARSVNNARCFHRVSAASAETHLKMSAVR